MNMLYFISKYLLNKRLRDDLKAIKIADKGYAFYGYDLCKKIGVIKELSLSSKSIAELMKRFKIKNEKLLEALLDFLVGKNILSFNKSKYSLTGQIPSELTKDETEFVEESYAGSSEWSLLFYKYAIKSLRKGSRHKLLGFDNNAAADLWDSVMMGPLFSFRHLAVKELLKNNRASDRIIDYGCGSGSSLITLISETNESNVIFGVDSSKIMLELAKARLDDMSLKGRNVKLIKKDLSAPFKFDEKFDKAFCSILINHLPVTKRKVFFKSVSENLNQGGKFVIFQLVNKNKFDRVFSDWLLYVVPSHQGFPLLDEYVNDINPYFSKVKVYLNGLIVIAIK